MFKVADPKTPCAGSERSHAIVVCYREQLSITMRLTILVLLGGLSVFLVGLGLLGTLLGVRAAIEGFSNAQTGVVMAGYYLGYILGTLWGPGIVRRVGHIRTFAAFAALGAASSLLFGLLLGLIVPRIRWKKKSSWGDL